MSADLEEQIQTDSGCAQLLHDLRYEAKSWICICGNNEGYRIKTRRLLYECSNVKCKKQTSLTSGTFFHGKKLPLTTCFKMLLDVVNGRQISGSAQAAELGVSASTVWRWRHEVRLFLDANFPKGDIIKVDRQLLIRVLFRRSIESPSINAPQTNQNETIDEDQFHPRSFREAQSVAEAQKSVSQTHKGVSEKYSQLYFAEFRFHQGSKMYDKKSLLRMIVRARRVSIKDIKNYSSPKFVDLPMSRLVS